MLVLMSCSAGGDSDERGVTTATASTSGSAEDEADVEENVTTAGRDDVTTTDGAGPSGGDSREDYVDALFESFVNGDPSEGTFDFGSDSAVCVAEEWVDLIGVEGLQASGTSSEDLADPQFDLVELGLDEDQAEGMVNALPDCGVDVVSMFVEVVAFGASEDQTRCVTDMLTEDVVRRLLAAAIVSDTMPADLEDEMAGLQACAT